MEKYLSILGDRTIRQFTIEEDGLYAWRCKVGQAEWMFGKLKVGDKIDGQFEGCGPLKLEADVHPCIHDEENCRCI